MNYQKSERYFLFALIAGVSLLAFFTFEPFLTPLILAVVFATVFKPVHRVILSLTPKKEGLAAFLTTVFILLVLVVPVASLGTQIFKEATQTYASVVNNGGVDAFSHNIEQMARNLGFTIAPGTLDLELYAKQGLSWLIQHFGSLFSNLAKILVGTFILLVALYSLFKDGSKLKKIVISASPLRDTYDEVVFSKLTLAINSVIRGSLAVGFIQGVLTAIGFALFGVPNPVLWGSVTAITALIPGVGTALVVVPGVLFLFFTGNLFGALGLTIWGVVAVGLVDNILGPKLVEKGMKLHPFLVLLSIFGGISLFGSMGFLLGPLVLSLLFALIEIYSVMRKETE